MAIESDYFLLLDDKSKQRNKLKNENIQGYDAPQVKRKQFQVMLVKFHQQQTLI